MHRERVRWETDDGFRYLDLDFSHFATPAEALPVIEAARKATDGLAPKSVYILNDMTGSPFNADVLAAIRGLAEHNRPYCRAAAAVGLTKLAKIAYDMIILATRRTDVRPFDTVDEGLRWLKAQSATDRP